MIIPFVDKLQLIDMREQVVDVPPQEVITSDNVVVSVDAVIYYEATDPQRLAYNVANFQLAVTKLAQTNLRNVIGDMQLDDALTSRDTINAKLRDILDDATDKWGTRVVRVEIQRIDPPPDVVELDAPPDAGRAHAACGGDRGPGCPRSGDHPSRGREAVGDPRGRGRPATADPRSTGSSRGGRTTGCRRTDARDHGRRRRSPGDPGRYAAIHEGDPTPDLLAIKYLEALARIADGRATKIFLPNEMGGLFGAVGGLAELLAQPRPDGPATVPLPAEPPSA